MTSAHLKQLNKCCLKQQKRESCTRTRIFLFTVLQKNTTRFPIQVPNTRFDDTKIVKSGNRHPNYQSRHIRNMWNDNMKLWIKAFVSFLFGRDGKLQQYIYTRIYIINHGNYFNISTIDPSWVGHLTTSSRVSSDTDVSHRIIKRLNSLKL